MSGKLIKIKDVDNIQARDVLEYLQKLKSSKHRGETSVEIIHKFWFISPRAVYKQLQRLKKHNQIRVVRIRYKKAFINFYEAK